MPAKYVTIKKLSEHLGYSEEAIRQKIKKKVWKYKVHWKYAPDNRVMCIYPAVQQWIEDYTK